MRNYNEESKNTKDHQYAYNFDFDVMHHFMIKSFVPFFVKGNVLELGSFKGNFTKRLLQYFDAVTCIEASSEAAEIAKKELGNAANIIVSTFEEAIVDKPFDNIILTHVLEHLDERVSTLSKIKSWLSNKGRLFIVCPNANAASRQIAVNMGLMDYNTTITESEKLHGHRITYTMETLCRDVNLGGLEIIHKSGIFFKSLANFQWAKLLNTSIISQDYLEGCYQLGLKYPDLCASIFLVATNPI